MGTVQQTASAWFRRICIQIHSKMILNNLVHIRYLRKGWQSDSKDQIILNHVIVIVILVGIKLLDIDIEIVQSLSYLGDNMNDMSEELRIRVMCGSLCQYALGSIFRLVVLYGFDIWTLIVHRRRHVKPHTMGRTSRKDDRHQKPQRTVTKCDKHPVRRGFTK